MRWGLNSGLVILLIAIVGILCSSCAKEENKAGPTQDKTSPPEKKAETPKHDDHSGWWCPEHGVPEDVCTRCNNKLVAKFKKKGDWCEDHERPKSQCFKCDPKLEAKFAALFRAKEGKAPPPITDP